MTDGIILVLIGFIISMITVMTPIIKLNTTITELNINMKTYNCSLVETQTEVREIKESNIVRDLKIDRLERKV
jgi:cell division protein FtsL